MNKSNSMPVKLIKTQAKSIFTKTKLGNNLRTVNQYVGCQHACLYCYAKFLCQWKDCGKWGSWVEAKMNAPELVKNKFVRGEVFMSSASDCYQPLEKELGLTRKVLENMNKEIPLSILTKSDLVLRDLDIFKQFKSIDVGLTVNSFDEKQRAIFEPFAVPKVRRIAALKTLKANGIKTYAFVSPLIPGLIDLPRLIAELKDCADYFWFEFINVRAAGFEFVNALKTKFPESHKLIADKEKFERFVQDCRKIIYFSDIQVEGVVRH